MVKQGDIIKLELNPTVGHEEEGYRPCLCLSNETLYDKSKLIIIAPISNTPREYPLYYSLAGITKITTGKVLLDQLRAIDPNSREYHYIESIDKDNLLEILTITKLIFDEDK